MLVFYLISKFSGKNYFHHLKTVKHVYDFEVYQTQNDEDDKRNQQPFKHKNLPKFDPAA